MKRVSVWMASAAASLLAVPAVAGDDVDSQLAQMQEIVKGLQQKVDAQQEQIQHQNELLQDAQRAVRADEQQSRSGLSAFLDSIDVDGGVAGSYNFNMNTPTDGSGGSGQNTGQSGFFMPFHPDANSFQVDQVWFGIGKPATEESRGGFRFDIFFGQTASAFSGGSPVYRDASSNSTNDYVIDQAYVEYLAPIADIDLKLGKFDTVVGAEVIKQWNNFNITRGIVYTMLQPVTHLGIMGTVPIGDMAEFGAGLVNSGGSTITAPDDSEEKSYLVTLKLGDNRANIRGTFVYGSEPSIVNFFDGNVHQTNDKVGLVDATAWFNPTDKVSLWANYDYLFVKDTGYYANGIAVAGRVEVLPDFGLAVRGEYVRENASPSHGALIFPAFDLNAVDPTAQVGSWAHDTDAWSVTGTADYALTDHLKVKSELRWDRANGNGNHSDPNSPGNNQFAENRPNNYDSIDQLVWLIAAEYVF